MEARPRRAPLLALGFGLLVLVAVELTARLLLGAPRAELFAEVPSASGTLTRQDGETLTLLYQGAGGPGPIRLAPPPRRPRVVWMGGSSIRGGNPGMPIEREAAHVAGRLLGAETINMAAPGLDSGHHLSLLPDVLALSPTAVVIYAGHNDLGNEVLMARYSGRRFQRTARLRWLLRHSRVFTALEDTIRQRSVLRVPDPSMLPRFSVDDATRGRVHEGFRQRMGALIRALREAGVVVVLATPASNPTSPSAEWRCPEAIAALGFQGRWPEAFPVGHLDRQQVAALHAQEDCDDLRWVLARLDQDGEALDALRDADPLPLRADRAQAQAVRELAEAHGAVLADSNARFRQLGGGVEHPSLFDDPMHFTEQGHRVLGGVVAEALAGALQRRLAEPLPSVTLPPVDLAACGDLPCRVEPPRPLR